MPRIRRLPREGTYPCPICAQEGNISREFKRRQDEVLNLMGCPGCGCEYLAPQPSSSWLSEEYHRYYERRFSSVERPKDLFFDELLTGLNRDFSDKKVLDIGAAEGDLIFALTNRWPAVDAYAIEGNPEAGMYFDRLPCTYYNTDIADWLKEGHQKHFDYIFLFDLLEHVRDPVGIVRDLAQKHLLPGGLMVGTFPSVSSLSKKVLGRLWFQYKVEHLFYFSDRAVTRLEEAGGMQRVALREVFKKLPMDYFLSVGAEFGPKFTTSCCRLVQRIIPSGLGRVRIPLMVGEYLWIAELSD